MYYMDYNNGNWENRRVTDTAPRGYEWRIMSDYDEEISQADYEALPVLIIFDIVHSGRDEDHELCGAWMDPSVTMEQLDAATVEYRDMYGV